MKNEKLRLPITGNFSIDASTGFYHTGVSNEVFSLVNNYAMLTDSLGNTTTRYDSVVFKTISQDRERNSGTLGAAAFIHPSWRATKDLRVMGALGFGSSPNLNYSILLGGGVMVGQKNRVGVFAGLSINNVKELSKKYRGDNKEFLPQGTAVTGLDMTNTFVNDYFFSITYSFGFKKAQNAAASGGGEEKKEDEKKEGQ